jgi:aromatic-L-amino-acid decarboxylase
VSFDSMGSIPYADFGVELTSPSRGVVVWSILRELGVEGVRQRIVEDNDRALRVAELADAHPRLESLTRPMLSVACVRYVPPEGVDGDDLNSRLLRRLVRETGYLPSSTLVDGTFVIRPCFINVRTVDDDIEGFVAAIVEVGDDLTAGADAT